MVDINQNIGIKWSFEFVHRWMRIAQEAKVRPSCWRIYFTTAGGAFVKDVIICSGGATRQRITSDLVGGWYSLNVERLLEGGKLK